jgi:hypothetical protein
MKNCIFILLFSIMPITSHAATFDLRLYAPGYTDTCLWAQVSEPNVYPYIYDGVNYVTIDGVQYYEPYSLKMWFDNKSGEITATSTDQSGDTCTWTGLLDKTNTTASGTVVCAYYSQPMAWNAEVFLWNQCNG